METKEIEMLEIFFDPVTLAFYCLIAGIGVYYIYKGVSFREKSGVYSLHKKWGTINRNLLICFILWVFVSVFRFVDKNIGGTDAPAYIEYFNTCLSNSTNLYSYRAEPFFRYFTKLCKILLRDYHFYFGIIYSVLIIGIIRFFKAYYISKMCCIPMFVSFYMLVYSFNVVRNGFSIGILMLSIACLQEDKYKWSLLLCALSVLMHSASVFYAPFVVIYIILRKKLQNDSGKLNKKGKGKFLAKLFELTYRKLFIIAFGLMLIAEKISNFIIVEINTGSLKKTLSNIGLGQPFGVYANSAYGDNFWRDLLSFRISRPQWILMILVFIFYKPMMKFVEKQGSKAIKAYNIILAMLIYNMVILPTVYYMHIWRDPEYFLLGRVVIWGVMIGGIINKSSQHSRSIIRIITVIVSISFFLMKIYHAHNMSHLTPYYFEPIGYLLKAM